MVNAYKQAGVNIEAGYEAVERMKSHVARTKRRGMLGGLGGFGGMFDLSALDLKEPVLVSATDGVGTKLMLAFMLDQHDTIGQDVVAMCVNDIIVQGAAPLYFLDYIACGKLAPTKIEAIVKGVADGCVQAQCALIGGETAEMPGMYAAEEYDIAGFAVGAAEKSDILTGEEMEAGDVLIGLTSSGLHSNGFSLVRKVFLEDGGWPLAKTIDSLGQTLGEVLLTPTKIYVKPMLACIQKKLIVRAAHITGGGFYENIPRALTNGLGVEIDYGSWPVPPIFSLLQQVGHLSAVDMFHTFNMGIGMVLIVKEGRHQEVLQTLSEHGESAYMIGRVTHGGEMTIGGIDT
ncbi:phosphoribosylformylglycinamidine cyclo-ligase [Bacillus sp. FSL W7-1360]